MTGGASIGSRWTTRGALIVAGLLLVSLVARSINLSADPPLKLSASTDVYTDPPQYTLAAHNVAVGNESAGGQDSRFILFTKSSVNALASVVFSVFGAGLWQSNLVGLFFSFGSLVLIFLLLYKASGFRASLFYLILMAFSYNQFFYGRMPFLEHAMTFFPFLAAVLIVYSQRTPVHLLAGLSLGIGIFYGKVLGVIFLAPFACCFLYLFFYGDRVNRIIRPALFVVGLGVVGLVWYFFSYLPVQSQVAEYLGEQSISLYGPPDALKSIADFCWSLVTFGSHSRLFERMTTVSLFGAVLIGWAALVITRKQSWRNALAPFNVGTIFILAAIVSFYLSLMIWNYRPLRYQLELIYLFTAAAAVVLAHMWQVGREVISKSETATEDNNRQESSPSLLFYFLIYPILAVPVYQIYLGIVKSFDVAIPWGETNHQVVLLTGMATVAVAAIIYVRKHWLWLNSRYLLRGLVLMAMVWVAGVDMFNYFYWMPRATFTARDSSREISKILASEATISGPYAPLLAMENDRANLIHMFGVSKPDPDFFRKFGVTHLLVDRANESRAREDYPAVMDSASHLLTYHIGALKVKLFRVAGSTGNPEADSYTLSDYERAIVAFNSGDTLGGFDLVRNVLARSEGSQSYCELIAAYAENQKDYDYAETMFQKSVEFSPTNYNLNARLGIFYKDRYLQSNYLRHKQQGIKYFKLALKYAPAVAKIKQTLRELEES